MTTYYVAGNGNDSNSGLTRALAKRTLQVAASLLQAGDTLLVGAGTYAPRWQWDEVLRLENKNNVQVKAIVGEAQPRLESQGLTGKTVYVKNCTNCLVEGLLLVGCATTIDYTYAYNNRANRNTDPKIIDNGLELDGGHHNTIKSVTAVDFSGCGFRVIATDYFELDGCVAKRNAFWSPWGCQGITIGSLVNSDTVPGVHNVVKNCISEDNRSYILWWVIEQNNPSWGITEGHGIIVDTQAGGYVGTTEIRNNFSRRNGGSGIQAFNSQATLVIKNNTVENNNKTPERAGDGNISLRNSANITVENNTINPDPGIRRIGLDRVTEVTIHYDYITGTHLA